MAACRQRGGFIGCPNDVFKVLQGAIRVAGVLVGRGECHVRFHQVRRERQRALVAPAGFGMVTGRFDLAAEILPALRGSLVLSVLTSSTQLLFAKFMSWLTIVQ